MYNTMSGLVIKIVLFAKEIDLPPWSTLQSKLVRGGEVTLLSIWSGYKLQGKRSLQPKVLCYPAQEWTRSDMKAKAALTWCTKFLSSNAVKIE